MENQTESLLEIGTIVGTHGLRGDLKVRLKSGDPELLLALRQVGLCLPTGETLQVDISRQVLHKGQVLLRFLGYETINQAEKLLAARVVVAESELPQLANDEYYWGQLKGLRVVDQRRGEIGQIRDLFSTSAHDTYVVRGELGEVLVPAVRQFILEINLEERIMHVDLPEGLIPENHDL